MTGIEDIGIGFGGADKEEDEALMGCVLKSRKMLPSASLMWKTA